MTAIKLINEAGTHYTHDPVIVTLDDIESTYPDSRRILIVWHFDATGLGGFETPLQTEFRSVRSGLEQWNPWVDFEGAGASRRLVGQAHSAAMAYYSAPGLYQIRATVFTRYSDGHYTEDYFTKNVLVVARTGRNIYWSPTGSDANDGLSSGAPLQTLGAVRAVLETGATIHMENGVLFDQTLQGTDDWNDLFEWGMASVRTTTYGAGAKARIRSYTTRWNIFANSPNTGIWGIQFEPSQPDTIPDQTFDNVELFAMAPGALNFAIFNSKFDAPDPENNGGDDRVWKQIIGGDPTSEGFGLWASEITWTTGFCMAANFDAIVAVASNWSGGSSLEHSVRNLTDSKHHGFQRCKFDWTVETLRSGAKPCFRHGACQFVGTYGCLFVHALIDNGFDSSGTYDCWSEANEYRESSKNGAGVHYMSANTDRLSFRNCLYVFSPASNGLARSPQRAIRTEHKGKAQSILGLRRHTLTGTRVVFSASAVSRECFRFSTADFLARDATLMGPIKVIECELRHTAYYIDNPAKVWGGTGEAVYFYTQDSNSVPEQGTDWNLLVDGFTAPDPDIDRVNNHNDGTFETKAEFAARPDVSNVDYATLTMPSVNGDSGDASLAALDAPDQYRHLDYLGFLLPHDGSNWTRDIVELNPAAPAGAPAPGAVHKKVLLGIG